MTRPDDIPEWAWDRARDVAFDFDCDWTADGRQRGEVEERAAIAAIARALLDAERRGINRAADIYRDDADPYSWDYFKSAELAIRNLDTPQNPE